MSVRDPSRYSGANWTEKVQKAMAACRSGDTLDLRLCPNSTRLPDYTLSSPDGYLALEVVGNGVWCQFAGDFKFRDLKDGKVSRLGTIGKFTFSTQGSSSRNRLENLHSQGGGFEWLAPNVGDVCKWTCDNLQATNCPVGAKVVGPDALKLYFVNFGANQCPIGLDLRAGGSGSEIHASVFSDCDEAIVVNAGYLFDATGIETERAVCAFRSGGGDAGGNGAPATQTVRFTESRDTSGQLAKIGKSGRVSLTFDHVKGDPRPVVLENRNGGNILDLTLVGTSLVQNVGNGPVLVNGAMPV